METDEELECGFGASTPPGDNLCNDYVQGLAEGFGALAAARGDRIDRDDMATLSDAGSASIFGNVAVIRRPIDKSAWPALAARMWDFYSGRPGGSFLVFSAWPTPDLRELDFGRVGHPPLMFRSPGPVQHEPIEDFEIRPVTDSATARDWEEALVHGYPEPALQPFEPGCFLPERAVAAPGWRHWLGYLAGEPVGTASAFVGEHHVDVEFISTLQSVRGRGIGRALTATATRAAPELPAMLISSDPGRTVYERLGYLPLLRFTLWAGHRERDPTRSASTR
jgi:GNAT superfamily N-acetyltransferase